jgi:hypothetical protein
VNSYSVLLCQEDEGLLHVALYHEGPDGQVDLVTDSTWSREATTEEITRWLVRHLAPRLRLPLR